MTTSQTDASTDQESLDENDALDPTEVVTFTDEEGVAHHCVVLAVIEHAGTDYAMLAHVDEVQSEDEDGELELFLFRYEVDEEDTEVFSYIEDEATYAAVQVACETLLTAGE